MLAIFDLDYTLTRRGTWGRFVWRTVRTRPWLWGPLLIETIRDQRDYKRGLKARGAVKKSMMRWSLMRRDRAQLEEMADAFADAEVPLRLRPGALAALKFHRDRGDRILIASAAVDLIVRRVCERLEIEDYVCTRLEWDGEALLEEFASENCYGDAKRRAVAKWRSEQGEGETPCVFYTDSRADFALSPDMDQIIVVNPKAKTQAEAVAEALVIQNWDAADGFDPEDVSGCDTA